MKWLCFVISLILLSGFSAVGAQTSVLVNPVAYKGQDGNIFVTDGTSTIQLTDDAVFDDLGLGIFYGYPRWSPDGTKLAFVRYAAGWDGLMIAESGQSPRLLLGEEQEVDLTSNALAWSPDSTQVAFYAYNGDEEGVFAVNIEDGSTYLVAEAFSSAIGEAGAIDPAVSLTSNERGFSLYGSQLVLAWTSAGIALTGFEGGYGVYLVTPEGDLLWHVEVLTQIVFSADGEHLFGQSFMTDGWEMILDMTTGETIPITLPQDAMPVGWAGDTLLYRTRTEVISISGIDLENQQVGFEVFDWMWGFEAESARLHLWAYSIDGEDRNAFKPYLGFQEPLLQGYDIAVVYEGAADTVILRYVTSSVPAVLAISEGANANEVRPLYPRSQAILLQFDFTTDDEFQVGSIYSIDGGHAMQSTGEFEAVGNEVALP